jgi:predicted RNA-binding Zn ribbon-like protein
MERLCLDFINSEFHNFRGLWIRDDLQDPAWRAQFLQRWNLCVPASPDAPSLAQLTALRTLLFRIVETLSQHQTIAEQDIAALNMRLGQTSFTYQITLIEQGYHLVSIPKEHNWDWVQSAIIADFLKLLTEHEPQRLRVCANTDCLWIFYDESKNRTRRYCTVDKCANLVKLRRFRAKHKILRQL